MSLCPACRNLAETSDIIKCETEPRKQKCSRCGTEYLG